MTIVDIKSFAKEPRTMELYKIEAVKKKVICHACDKNITYFQILINIFAGVRGGGGEKDGEGRVKCFFGNRKHLKRNF